LGYLLEYVFSFVDVFLGRKYLAIKIWFQLDSGDMNFC
jgi:hypothetical protein